MAHFYLDEHLLSAEPGSEHTVTGAEARHAVSVSRARVGERIAIGNGAGLTAEAEITAVAADTLHLRFTHVQHHPRSDPQIWLAQALAKAGRDEQAVQAATELGVDGIIPWAAERCIVKWDGPKLRKGQERWQAITREATKQSIRPWTPDVAALARTSDLATLSPDSRLLVLDPAGDTPLSSIRPDDRNLVLVVGPEGGISPAELGRLQAAGAETVRLGSGVLRTSTAGPAAISVLNVALNRW